jgi:hypothetical protein
MNLRRWTGHALFLLGAASLVVNGCGQADSKGGPAKDKTAQLAQAKGEKKDDHSGWWCEEHGVPEEICGQCNAKLAAELKKKGDWCKEHDRPDSQCFLCHTELKERFAAQYRAKYGKEPPPIEEAKKEKGAEKEESKN